MKIRPACMDDLGMLFRIVGDATRHMDSQGINQWDHVYPSRQILKGDVERREMKVVEKAGRVTGLIVLNEDEPREYEAVPWEYGRRILVVHRLTVDPAHQRMGLATCLMDHAETSAILAGYDAVRLDAFCRNPGAIALYEGRGYRKAGMVAFRKGEFFCFEKRMAPGQSSGSPTTR